MLIAVIALVIGAALYVMNMVGVNINANVICSLGVLIVGFAMLIKGADLFVEGASKIAAKFKIPQIVIGLTIAVSYTHLRAHETRSNLVCRLLLEKIFF